LDHLVSLSIIRAVRGLRGPSLRFCQPDGGVFSPIQDVIASVRLSVMVAPRLGCGEPTGVVTLEADAESVLCAVTGWRRNSRRGISRLVLSQSGTTSNGIGLSERKRNGWYRDHH
jgi:hypothetical protein